MASPEQPVDPSACYIEHVTAKSTKKTLLHEMNLEFPEGQVTAILGPSGSGKTTLLHTLVKDLPSNLSASANLLCLDQVSFVPQDDRLHGFFTVKSYLKHYARLSGTPTKEVEPIIKSMGLEGQADTMVGDLFIKGLSGGQKRRLSIALEALSSPEVLVLDEPTSGLDAESAFQVMEFLHEYAKSGNRRVILTIHQPSYYIWNKMIDHVVLLSKGKLMYQGPRHMMEDFFVAHKQPTPNQSNPADHYVTLVNDEFRMHALSVDEWAQLFLDYTPPTTVEEGAAAPRRTASMGSVRGNKVQAQTNRSNSPLVVVELTYRYFLNLWFNPGILGTRIAMYSMLAGMVGALFWNLGERFDEASIMSRTAVSFYCVAFFVFMSVAVLPFTVIERAIVDKEVRNGYYSAAWYQVAQAISSIPGTAVLAALVTAIIILTTKMCDPFWYFITMFLSLMAAEALAQLVSHVVPHFVIGMALVAGMYGFFMLFMGFMVFPSDFPSYLTWTYNIGFHTYAFRVFMTSEFQDIEYFDSALYSNGSDVLKTFEIEDVDRTQDLMVLLGYTGVLHLISIVVLYLKYSVFGGRVTEAVKKE